jgi:hypothetical protein
MERAEDLINKIKKNNNTNNLTNSGLVRISRSG